MKESGSVWGQVEAASLSGNPNMTSDQINKANAKNGNTQTGQPEATETQLVKENKQTSTCYGKQ